MAQRTHVELIDDLDGTPADETVDFGLDGVTYQVDLSKEHAEDLRMFLQRYTLSARQLGGPKKSKKGNGEAAKIRAWAKEQGVEVPSRGRIPKEITEAYTAAQQADA